MILLLALWLLSVGIHLYGAYLCRKHFSDQPIPPDTPYRLIPVSILKPLKGVDPGLEKNLESFFELDYPHYEILFSVASPNDEAASIARRLMARFPHIQTKLIIGEKIVGKNPKINNLVQSYDVAQYPWILISDSNIRVRADYLKKLTSQIKTSTGMITSVVLGTHAIGIGGKLEETHLNTFYAKAMVLASKVNRDCVVGKSMLFRKSSAERFGGLKALGGFLAEDYMAGEAMKQVGMKVSTAWQAVPQFIGDYSIHDYWQRHIRWGRIRKSQSPLAFIAEILGSSLLSGLIASYSLSSLFHLDPAAIFLAHVLMWATADFSIMHSVGARIRPVTGIYWIFRELLALPLWIHIASGNSVLWRGTRYKLRLGGILTDQEAYSS